MFRVNKSDREYLEKIGVLKPEEGRYKHMAVCNVKSKSKKKSFYVEDHYKKFLINRKDIVK